jgi:hypothetical protein
MTAETPSPPRPSGVRFDTRILDFTRPMAHARMVRRLGSIHYALLMGDGDLVCRRCVAAPDVWPLIARATTSAGRGGARDWTASCSVRLAQLAAYDRPYWCAHCGGPAFPSTSTGE